LRIKLAEASVLKLEELWAELLTPKLLFKPTPTLFEVPKLWLNLHSDAEQGGALGNVCERRGGCQARGNNSKKEPKR
jgi:hypothetical protein